MGQRKKVEAGRGIMVGAELIGNDGTRRAFTLDPVRTLHLDLEVREVETTLVAGFQMLWGSVDVDGDELELFSGAGLGSNWATIDFRGKQYAISAAQLVEEFLARLDEGGEEGAAAAE